MLAHPRFQLGQLIQAKVIENLSSTTLVVDIQGSLFRVRNQSGHYWKAGDEISLKVTALNPIEFQILTAVRGFDRFA